MSRPRPVRRPWRHAIPGLAVAGAILVTAPAAGGQLAAGMDVNVTRRQGNDAECVIAANPASPRELYSLCVASGEGITAARSRDGGATWRKAAPEEDEDGFPLAGSDPSVAWDTFGNLFAAYIGEDEEVVLLLSTNGGASFRQLTTFGGSVDQPTVVAARTSVPDAPVAVWVAYNESGKMVAAGAAVTGRNAVGAFHPPAAVPSDGYCSYGDIAIHPDGAVVVACQLAVDSGSRPSAILVSVNPRGLGGTFAQPVARFETRVGWLDDIPAQGVVGIDGEAALAFDAFPSSPTFGRLYLVYTDEQPLAGSGDSDDTEILVLFSDDVGTSWSAPVRLNDDPGERSQFLPRIVVDHASGEVLACWHDARNSADNTGVQVFCSAAAATRAVPRFLANVEVSDCLSTSSLEEPEFGHYTGLAFVRGFGYPIWADRSNSTGDNPDLTASFDAYVDRLTRATLYGGTRGDRAERRCPAR